MKVIFKLLQIKFVEMIREKTFPEIMVFFVKSICAILLALALIFPENLVRILDWNNHLFLKVLSSFLFSFLLFFNMENLIKLYDFLKNNIEISFGENETELRMWVNLDELISYLLENKTFKIEVEKTFDISRKQYMKISKKLDSLWIFERWERNQRILKEWYDYDDLQQLLTTWMIKISDNTYSTTPAVADNI